MNDYKKWYVIYQLLTDPTLPDAPDFAKEQWNALCGDSPMNQEIFDTCLSLCADGGYGEMYEYVKESFPEFC